MRLFVFETCPYCLRVKILVGLKGLNLQTETLSPGVLPNEIAGHVARFSVPILQDGGLVIQDSAKIIRYLDGQGQALLSDNRTSSVYEAWHARIKSPLNALCYPRMISLAPGELASPAARDWFAREIPGRIGMSLATALNRTDAFVDQLADDLAEAYSFLSGPMRYDTLASLADLMILTMVAELRFPEPLGTMAETLMHRARLTPFVAIDRNGRAVSRVFG